MTRSKPALLLRRLLRQLHPLQTWRCLGVLLLGLCTSVFEVASIGAVVPFLAVLVSPERFWGLDSLQPLIRLFGWTHPAELLLPVTVAFVLAAIIAGVLRVALAVASTRLAFAAGAYLGQDIVRRTLHQPYAVHLQRHSSSVLDGVVGKTQLIIAGVLLPLVQASVGSVMLVAIGGALLVWQPVLAVGLLVVVGVLYGLLMYLTRRRLRANSEVIAFNGTQRIKTLQEALGGIRDIQLDGTQQLFLQAYGRVDNLLRHAQAQNAALAQVPRFMVEALGAVALAVAALWLALQPGGLDSAVPILGGLALAAQRILPIAQQCYQGWALVSGNRQVLADVLDLLEQPVSRSATNVAPLAFQRDIRLEQVAYRYLGRASLVLADVTLRIPRGARIGVMGATGSGKSTLLDLLMGFLLPVGGVLSVDGVPLTSHNLTAWQRHIAHVPQQVFLSDASVAENIAFGVSSQNIDQVRLQHVTELAQLAEVVAGLPQGYATRVGEYGVSLSGGQRQRIGIARALYKQADVLVLDEATNALDIETECRVLDAISRLGRDVTLFLITHRPGTLDACDGILEVSGGRVGWSKPLTWCGRVE